MVSEIIVEFPSPLTDKEKKMIYGYKGEVVRCKDCRWGREACGNITDMIGFVQTEKGEKMKIFNLIVEILLFITSVSYLIQDVRRWKNDKKEREFNKWLEERRKDETD